MVSLVKSPAYLARRASVAYCEKVARIFASLDRPESAAHYREQAAWFRRRMVGA